MSNGLEVARYSFLPWLRTGAALGVKTVDDFGSGAAGQIERSTTTYEVFLNAAPISQAVQLYGPGDITGLDRRAIVRTNPGNRVMDFEPNYLPFVDFYDGDLPWRFTPAAPSGQRLRPWLALIALADGEYEEARSAGALLPAITVAEPQKVLSSPDELWAWAHVHVNEDLKPQDGDTDDDARTLLEGILRTNADAAGSRVVAPRNLLPSTGYTAFLVPTFETGRLTGLGQEIPAGIDGLAPAWQGPGAVTLPTYFSWRFRTGVEGDFEHLVRLLVPRVIDPRVGIRDMDVQEPGFGLPPAGPPVLGIEGALRTVTTQSTPWPDPTPFQDAMTTTVNLAENLIAPGGPDDPTITLPLYGRWHALNRRLGQADTAEWVSDLNLDPRTRAAAGLGTRVVQTNQEKYMKDSWEQVGEIVKANSLLNRARLSVEASQALFARNVETLDTGNLISLTGPVHSRILGSPRTIAWQLSRSRVTPALIDPAFRRAVRLGGPIRKRAQGQAGRAPDSFVQRVNDGVLTAARPKRAGSGQRSVDRNRNDLRPTSHWERLLTRLGTPRWLLPLLVVLLALVGVLLVVAGSAAVGGVLLVLALVALAVWPASRRAAEVAAALDMLDLAELDPETVADLPARPDFELTTMGETPVDSGSGGTDSLHAANFRAAAVGLQTMLTGAPGPEPEAPAVDLADLGGKVLAAIEPRTAVPRMVNARLGLTIVDHAFDIGVIGGLPGRPQPVPDPHRIVPIMAAPDLPYPMYKELEQVSSELLVPNLGLIERNTISLLEANQPFIEAYMVGLNHEMARELLWREYPTDQRGSYFRQFWDVVDAEIPDGVASAEEAADKLRDIPSIHTWHPSSDLGAHNHRLPPGDTQPRLVLVIRGDLLNRYPTALVTAAPARWPNGATSADDRVPVYDDEIGPLFRARVGQDITFFGFDLTAAQVDGTRDPVDNDPGWFFIIRERPGEPRFGLDVAQSASSEVATNWNDLSWGHVGPAAGFDTLENIRLADGLHHVSIAVDENPEGAQWGSHAADMAHILYQVPVLVAVHAERMLPEGV